MKYLGNKDKVSTFIKHVLDINELSGGTALDLFSGTGSVSKLLSNRFKTIHSVDKLFLSEVLTFVKLNPTPNIDSKLMENINKVVKDGFITNHYSSKVGINIFTEEIANHIDGALHVLYTNKENLTRGQFLFILNAIVEAADFRSNIMGSYESFYKRGWRKQCLKPWSVKLYNNNESVENTFFNMNVDDFFPTNVLNYNLVYCDTPYNSRQYSSVFHVPETICNGVEIKTKGKVNLPIGTFKSKFSKKTEVSVAYDNLINNISKITNNFLMSYNNEGLLTIDDLQTKLTGYFNEVKIYEMDYRKFNTNRKNDNNTVIEYLIYGKK
jgi:adenine-specific DNA-methyltransferase